MAVPDAGTANLSLLAIYNELAENNYADGTARTNVSLTNLSTSGDPPNEDINTVNDAADRPDGSAPHAMSEFYSYDHDAFGLQAPEDLEFNPTSTTTTTLTFGEPANSSRVYIYQYGANAINGAAGAADNLIQNNGSDYVTVNGSGTTDVVLGDSNDKYGNGSAYVTLSLGANDYVNLYLKAYHGGAYSGASDSITCWTKVGTPTNLAASSVNSSGMTISWDEPSGGVHGTNGYRLYFGTNSNVTTNTPYNQGGTSKSFTGLSASTTYYFAVKAKGGSGYHGDITSTGNQATAAATTFSSVIADFTLTGTAGTSGYIYSTYGESFIINNPSGDLTVTMPDPRAGTMQIAMKNGSVPATSDYVNDGAGNLITISSPSDGDEIYVRWRFIPHTTVANGAWTATFTCNGVSDVVAVGGRTTA
jgi:hypothetical protein